MCTHAPCSTSCCASGTWRSMASGWSRWPRRSCLRHHIAAAVSNLTTNAPKFLEQSIYADGLTPASIGHLHDAARQAWATAFDSVVTQARERVDADADSEGDLRMRFGVYFFSEPAPAPAVPPAPTRTKPSPQRRRAPAGRKP